MLDLTAIAVLESFLECKLPADYAAHLQTNTGSSPQPYLFTVPGEGDSALQYFFPLLSKTKTETLVYKLKLYRNRTPAEMLPIGADASGNLILLALTGPQRGHIFFWDHEREADDEAEQPYYGNIKPLAPTFTAFLASLH